MFLLIITLVPVLILNLKYFQLQIASHIQILIPKIVLLYQIHMRVILLLRVTIDIKYLSINMQCYMDAI